ncbi:MAG: Fe-S-binding domain-containing protein [Actinobacteria bacterium]|nr:Fe-S-binding domain-containing protein [Actinomycetota bacterium]
MGIKLSGLIYTLILFPLFGAVVIFLMPKKRFELFQPLAIFLSIIPFSVCLYLFSNENSKDSYQQFGSINWISSYGIKISLGFSGMSHLLLSLTSILVLLSFLSVTENYSKSKGFIGSILVLHFAVNGVFLSGDLLSLFIFFEAILIPMYFLMGIWGGDNRRYATIKFIIYTVFGSIFIFIGTVYTGVISYSQTGTLALDYVTLSNLNFTSQQSKALFLLFTFGFLVKVPLFPLHTWLPDAHVEAPTAGSILLAGVLLKVGAFGILRVSIPFFTEGFLEYRDIIAILSVIGIIYGAVVAIAQIDIKKLIAYSSISHMGFVMLGISSGNLLSLEGAIIQMVNHGLTSGALFMLVGFVYERRHTRRISDFGGLKITMPKYAAIFLFTSFASIGLPGLNGFVGEFMILMGSFGTYKLLSAISAFGVVLAAIYMLWAYQRMFTGEINNEENENLHDLDTRELVSVIPLLVLMLFIGVYPSFIESYVLNDAQIITNVVELFSGGLN